MVGRPSKRAAALHIVGNDLQVRVPPHRSKELVSSESLPYLGRHYRLKVQEVHQVGARLSSGYLRATVRPSEQGEQREVRIQQYLQNWYLFRALKRLQEKTDRHALQIGMSPTGVSTRNFRSRWGVLRQAGVPDF